MTHPNEGLLLGLRDGESISETDRAHIMACTACLTSLDEARTRAELIRDALDEGVVRMDLERAKAAVRARLDIAEVGPRFALIGSNLRRAAAILLVTAAAVSALQTPLVRTWLSDRVAPATGSADQGAGPATAAGELRAIAVAAQPGLVISLSGMDAGARMALVFEPRDDVEVSGTEGTRFTIADDRIEATDIVGSIVVRVPERAPSLTIMANGRMMFTGTESRYEIDASGIQADGGWVFLMPES